VNRQLSTVNRGYFRLIDSCKGAKLIGTNNQPPKPTTDTNGEIYQCEIVENDVYKANFFPAETFLLRVKGKGFKRHQIRLMMGALIDLGMGKINLDFLNETLDGSKKIKLEHIAQASGLILKSIELED